MNSRTVKIILVCFLGFGFFLNSCNNNTKPEPTTEEVQTKVIDVDALLADAKNLIGQSVTIEGVCTHICKHGGRKIFLMGSDDTKTIRVEGGEVGKFDAKCVNNLVTVKGKMCEQRIDEAYLQQWEEKVAAQIEEKHGETEVGCDTEKKARNEKGNSATERIADFRKRIAEREAEEGKSYLSFYYMEAEEYSVAE